MKFMGDKMKKNKIIMDILLEDTSIKVFYSDGEVKGLFLDEVTEYVYTKAKEELEDLNLQEKKQIVHNKMALTTLFFVAISSVIFNPVITMVTNAYIETLYILMAYASTVYAGVTTSNIFATSSKKKNIVKTIGIIDEILNQKNKSEFEPSFLESIKLSDTNYKFKTRGLETMISMNINLDETKKFYQGISDEIAKYRNPNKVIILESTETMEKQKQLVKTLKR